MNDIDLTLVIRGYDPVFPLTRGDVPTPGVRLSFDHRTSIMAAFDGDGVPASEVSFNRYLLACARGDDRYVGLPAFILRGFRHRNFFVRADSDLTRLADLKGRRVGTNSWSDSGTLWARAAMRDAGVEVADLDWTIGPLNADVPMRTALPGDASPPSDASRPDEGADLVTLLHRGEIDAITTAFPPPEVYRGAGSLRRLVADYPEVERDYYRRTGVYPGFHIVAVRRDVAAAHPQAVVGLYSGLRDAWLAWWEQAARFADASPWTMAELETLLTDFAGHLPPYGMESADHRRMLAVMCAEQQAQGLAPAAADPDEVFAGFEAIAREHPPTPAAIPLGA